MKMPSLLSDKVLSFLTRSAAALVLIPCVLLIFYLGVVYTKSFLYGLGALCLGEWLYVCLKGTLPETFLKKGSVILLGVAYILLGFLGLFSILHHSSFTLMGIFLMIWASDTGAYLVGNLLKGPKLWPSVSPGKTWSGFVGGLLTSVGVGYILYRCYNWPDIMDLPLITPKGILGVIVLIALAAPLGDLLESWVKRRFQIKDSSHLIPGHGGILDRLDSLLSVGLLLLIIDLIVR